MSNEELDKVRGALLTLAGRIANSGDAETITCLYATTYTHWQRIECRRDEPSKSKRPELKIVRRGG